MSIKRRIYERIYKIFNIFLRGFQFGYNFLIMAGAILFIKTAFSLTPAQESYLMSSIVVGSLIGASTAGMVVNHLGRKRTQLCLALLFLIGASFVTFASSLGSLIVGRLIQGIAGGAVTVVSPLYLAEIASPGRRGFVVGFHQFAVTFGALFAYGVSYLFSFSGSWKLMLGCSFIPALLYLIGVCWIPESSHVESQTSPSWKEILSRNIGLL